MSVIKKPKMEEKQDLTEEEGKKVINLVIQEEDLDQSKEPQKDSEKLEDDKKHSDDDLDSKEETLDTLPEIELILEDDVDQGYSLEGTELDEMTDPLEGANLDEKGGLAEEGALKEMEGREEVGGHVLEGNMEEEGGLKVRGQKMQKFSIREGKLFGPDEVYCDEI